ncbi:MAG: hypothetical protein ABIH87_00785 [bacterium]
MLDGGGREQLIRQEPTEQIDSPENQLSFDDWREKIEGAGLKPGNLENFLDTLEEMPMVEYPAESSVFLVDLLDYIKNNELDSGEFCSGIKMDSMEGLLLEGNIDEEGIDFFLIQKVFQLVKHKLEGINGAEIDDKHIRVILRLFDESLQQYNNLLESYNKPDYEERQEVDYDFGDEDYSMDYYESGWHEEEEGLSTLVNLIEFCGSKGMSESLPKIYQAIDLGFGGANFSYNIARALSNIDAVGGAQEMIKRLNKSQDKESVNFYSKILYLMEFGKISVKDGEAEYLERNYQLQGEQKDRVEVAFRITGDGKIGLFDKEEKLLGYFELGQLSEEEQKPIRQIMDNFDELAFADPDSDPQVIENFKKDYLQVYKTFHDETGIRLSDLTVREQVWFFQYLQEANEDEQVKAKRVARKFGREGIKAFISLESDKEMGVKILELDQSLSGENQVDMEKLLRTYSVVLGSAEIISHDMAEEWDGEDGLSEAKILEGLLVRAKDLLAGAHVQVAKSMNSEEKRQAIEKIIEDLSKENKKQQAISGRFRKVAGLLQGREPGSIKDIERYSHDQEVMLAELEKAGGKALLLRALQSRGELAPIPELFWKVDRNTEEYEERFGFDPNKLLSQLAEEGRQKVLVEFGPGSGTSKNERHQAGLDKSFVDVAVADKLYYSLGQLVENMIDWNKLENRVREKINTADRKLLADALYKLMMVGDGQIGQPDFEYSQERVGQLSQDPNSIRDILPQVCQSIGQIDSVPSDYSEVKSDGTRVYPDRQDLSQVSNQVKSELAKHMVDYIKDKEQVADVYDQVPAHPAGMMIGDFSRIQALADQQIDVAMGVRSTVYKEGEEYDDFMLEMFSKLNFGGVYVDDNIRENFGASYRVDQLRNIVNKWNEENSGQEINVNIILGPGVKGEDDRKREVPMALVASKNTDHTYLVGPMLKSGYRLVRLEDGQLLNTVVEEPELAA